MCFIFSKLCLTSDSFNCCAFFFKFFTIYEAVSTVRQFGHSRRSHSPPSPSFSRSPTLMPRQKSKETSLLTVGPYTKSCIRVYTYIRCILYTISVCMFVGVRSRIHNDLPPSTPVHVVSSACPAPSFVHLAINYVYVLLEFSLHASKLTTTTQPVALSAGGDSFT